MRPLKRRALHQAILQKHERAMRTGEAIMIGHERNRAERNIDAQAAAVIFPERERIAAIQRDHDVVAGDERFQGRLKRKAAQKRRKPPKHRQHGIAFRHELDISEPPVKFGVGVAFGNQRHGVALGQMKHQRFNHRNAAAGFI